MAMRELIIPASRVRFGLCSGFGRCHRVLASSEREDLPVITPAPFSDNQRRIVEKLWQEFFSDPSQWWDHRLEKGNAKYPDFKHKRTQEALWLNNNLKPPWVESKLVAMAPGSVQVSIFQRNIQLARMPTRDSVAWNALISGYVKCGQGHKALALAQEMQQEGLEPGAVTFVAVLNACASVMALEEGRRVHEHVIRSGLESNLFVGNSLVDMEEGLGTSSTNATGGSEARPRYLCGSTECMC
ncbi:unnamed protein product [Sphagnum jensenii]